MTKIGTRGTRWLDFNDIDQVVKRCRSEGKRIVQCHGVFDLLHPGHVAHLEEAKQHGDVLFVSVTGDGYVNKGPGRPVFPEAHRALMLGSLTSVDFVVISNDVTAEKIIHAIQPDVFVKGGDYADSSEDVTGNIRLEEEAVRAVGGSVVFTEAPLMSSSQIINAIKVREGEHRSSWIREFRERHGADGPIHWLNKVRSLKVLVIGEAIIDEYVHCEALGKSSKDPVLAFREIDSERQAGGSLAIARHCAGLGAEVKCLFRMGNRRRDQNLILQSLGDNIASTAVVSNLEPTIVKRRYVDSASSARVFETYVMQDVGTQAEDDEAVRLALMPLLEDVDIVLAADYGHGLFSEGVISDLSRSEVALAVNTQANAGNRGFNTISRYPRVNFACLNGGEVGLEMRRRHVTMLELVPKLLDRIGAQKVVVTEGSSGLVCCEQGGGVTQIPAFANEVTDRVGAGDALFAASSLLFAVEAPSDVTGFWGNLAGAAAVSQLGNRDALRSSDLIKHASSLLK